MAINGQIESTGAYTEATLTSDRRLRVDVGSGANGVIPSVAGLTATGTANSAATVTLAAAGAGVRNVVDGISWSYSGASLPSAAAPGTISISDGATVVFTANITAPGAGFFRVKRKGSANTAMTITLAAGGADVIGKVNADNAWTE